MSKSFSLFLLKGTVFGIVMFPWMVKGMMALKGSAIDPVTAMFTYWEWVLQ